MPSLQENSLTLGSDFGTTGSTSEGGSGRHGNGNGTLVTSEGEWSGSGSGAGVPQLLQRTIARQIRLVEPCIGKVCCFFCWGWGD